MEEISTAVAEFDSVELFPSAFDFGLTPSGIDDGVFTQGDGELQEEETLDAILTRAREDSVYVFPYSRMMTLLKCSGWNRWVFPKSLRMASKYSHAYFPFWTKKEGQVIVSYTGSTDDLQDGRDFFYLPSEILKYLLQFGNTYDPVGIAPLPRSGYICHQVEMPTPVAVSTLVPVVSQRGSKRKADTNSRYEAEDDDKLSSTDSPESDTSDDEEISDKRLAKQTKNSSVMLRPFGDYLFRGHKNPTIKVGCKYDILDQNKFFFVCKVKELSRNIARIHFPHWGKGYDIKDDVHKYYLAPYGTYSIRAGINVATNRYPDTFKSRCKSAEVSPENKASKPKIVKDSSSKSVVDHVGDKQSFEEIVEIHRSDPHFPFVLLEKTLFVSGWYKCPVPKNVSACPKFSSAHFPYWTKKEGHSCISHTGSTCDFLEGRDYFYLHDDIVQYCLQFGNFYDCIGISTKFNEPSNMRRYREPVNSTNLTPERPRRARRLERPGATESLSATHFLSWKEEQESKGFIFDDKGDIYIEKRIRVFVQNRTVDGTVVCYRPESTEQGPMYGILRDDNVAEVYTLLEVHRSCCDFIRRAKRPNPENKSCEAPDDIMELRAKIIALKEDHRIEMTERSAKSDRNHTYSEDQNKQLEYLSKNSKKLEKLYSDLLYQVRQIQQIQRANASTTTSTECVVGVDTVLSALIFEHKNEVLSLKESILSAAYPNSLSIQVDEVCDSLAANVRTDIAGESYHLNVEALGSTMNLEAAVE